MKRDERDAEALGKLHEPQRLAVALGLRHAVVAAHPFLGVAALLVADQHDRAPVEPRHAADDGVIVGVHAVTVQFVELVTERRGVVERVGSLRMARQLRDLPRREVREDARGERAALGPQPRDLLADVHFLVRGDEAQLVDLCLELGDRLFEIQETQWHGTQDAERARAAQIPRPAGAPDRGCARLSRATTPLATAWRHQYRALPRSS